MTSREGLVFEISAEDNASQTLRKVQGEVGEVSKNTNQASSRMQSASTSAGGLAANLGTLAKSAGLAWAAFEGVQAVNEAMRVGREYQVVIGDMRQAVINMTPDIESQAEAWETVNEAVEKAYDITGNRIPEMQQLMTDLIVRTGSVEVAMQNWERVLGAVNATGKNTTEVVKQIGNAATGDIAPLKELGLLTQEQIVALNGISDAGERAAKAFEIVDQRLQGYAEGLPAAEVQARKLESSKERLTAAVGNFFYAIGGGGAVLNGFISLMEGASKNVEEFVEVWKTAPGSITEAVTESQKALKALGDATESEMERINRVTGENQLQGIRQSAETRKMLIQAEIDAGRLEGLQGQLLMQRIDSIAQQRIEAIRMERGLYDTAAAGAEEARINALLDEQEVLQATTERERERKQLQLEKNNLLRKQEEELQKITDEQTKISVEARQALELKNLELRQEAQRKEAAKQRAKESDTEKAKLEAERRAMAEWWTEYQAVTAESARLAGEEIDAIIKAQQESVNRSREMVEGLQAQNRELELMRQHWTSIAEMEAEEADIIAQGQGRRIRTAAAGIGGLGESVGQFSGSLMDQSEEASRAAGEAGSEDERARLEAIAEENRLLAEQASRYEDLLSATGELGEHIASLAEQQWNFETATDAVVGALSAMSKIGAATAGILGDSVKEQAGIRAGFELAAAAAALGAGLFFGNPAFFAAAAQHTLSAGLFGAQATGIVGASGGGGGGGGGGSMKANFDFDADAEREKTAQAFADKLAAQNQGSFGRIELNLGSGNVYARRSEEFGRELVDVMEGALRNFQGRRGI